MRFLRGGLSTLILCAGCWTSTTMASTVLDIPGPTIGFADFGDSALADSWTQDFSVTNGSISVYVQGLEPSGGTINFYLTSAIGASATLSDLIAFTSIDVPFELTQETPFTGLNLGPGTYYLILADYTPDNNAIDGPDWNYDGGETSITEASGLTIGPGLGAFSLGPFAPAANFTPLSIDIRGTLDFTGTIVPVTSTPEPSTMLMLGAAFVAFGISRYFRSAASSPASRR